jgi:hypothetical protein
MTTLVEYMYRDASNYKQFGSFILGGQFEVSSVRDFLSDGEFFIPERVGVRSLVPIEKTADDHCLHTLEATSRADDAPALMSAELFIERVKRAAGEGWFYEKLTSSDPQATLIEGRRTGWANSDCDE